MNQAKDRGGDTETFVLVTGGAGYVGAHVCLALSEAGYTPVVYDNLSSGHAEFVRWGPLERGDVRDPGRLEEVISIYEPRAVLHFAARIEVAESVRDPLSHYRENVAGSVSLIEAACRAKIEAFVLSSTCAVYGEPKRIPMDEAHPVAPLSPYARSKWMVEQILADASVAYGLRSVSLRYFNAAGADPQARIGERHDPETHAVPLALMTALGQRPEFAIYGEDYDTRDGTPERDYVHVADLADAHVRALRYLLEGGETTTINLGTGRGTTVKELISTIGEVTGRTMPVSAKPRRPGDPPCLLADNRRARTLLGWAPRHSLEDIIQTAWGWHQAEGRRRL